MEVSSTAMWKTTDWEALTGGWKSEFKVLLMLGFS